MLATERLKRADTSSTLRSNSVILILPFQVYVHAYAAVTGLSLLCGRGWLGSTALAARGQAWTGEVARSHASIAVGQGTIDGMHSTLMHWKLARLRLMLAKRFVRSIVLAALVPAALIVTGACTFYGEHPARAFSDATGGEGLERVFWKDVQAGNWVEVERVLASNYAGVAPSGALDRAAALEQYRSWQLKEYSIGDVKTELNGPTIVVTYTITLNGSAGSQALPSGPQHVMTVWQEQKKGWMEIAHSVSPQQ
jgi:hypothetical protein